MTIAGLEFIDTAVQMPLMKLPVRTVIVPVASGRVLLSPASTLTREELLQAGAVTDIVAPNLFHTGGIQAAAAAHPRARVWGPPGCREKQPGVSWHGVFGEAAWPYEGELPMFRVAGMPEFNEHVFLHKASRSLLVTDLVFNLLDARGVGAWLILSLFGTHRRLGVSRVFMRFAKERPAFEASLRDITALEFDHLLPSHGAAVMNEGRAALISALRERGVRV
ncbi:hypothetical protein HPC49_26890 [Pyxidicoccus fallax]|uniref:DUF4336 domain-containing protein n=1 Tax=Pyxidicoccus fallax TaxID=394095 RepID=A0A848LGN6_9BACT|nr:hypothetical protein [Pyxidicoccus fallax]NMO15881.1 hypothetical protein [Pyxidicoccus fallax]NPC81832.1 hypothetical protein [Pyxidicoccus fallax]